VAAGQLLVVLDQAQLQAELQSLRAEQAQDRLNYQRFDYLARAGAASALERDELRQTFVASTARLRARQADLSFRDLRSPIAGTIGDLQVKVGDVIRAGDPFTTVIRNGELMARIDVPARVRQQLQLGQPVILEDPASNRTLARGVVDSIDPSVTTGTQVLLVKARFRNPDGALRNGLRVRTRVMLAQRQQLAVPVGSVTQSSAQSYVFRVGTLKDLLANPGQAPVDQLKQLPPGSRFALQTRVQLGRLQGDRYPVLRGLSAGDAVITSNLLNLRHGSLVAPAGS
jgi:RND family efflux transporter MFP subunit